MDLQFLLKNMTPTLNAQQVAFTALPSGLPSASGLPPSIIGLFKEKEGFTLLLPVEDAEALGMEIILRTAWITMNVNSDLEAVGFTASFSAALGKEGISCNVWAAVNHDHIFVPVHQGEQAMRVLQQLSQQ